MRCIIIIIKIGLAYNNNDYKTIEYFEDHINLQYSKRIIIAGGRDFNDYNLMKKKLDNILINSTFIDTLIISGLANGADLLAKKYAQEYDYDIAEFAANWAVEGKSAGYKRNSLMSEYATHLIAFWDGKSKGTKHMIDIAKQKQLIIRIINY